jgi:hypothetical protein
MRICLPVLFCAAFIAVGAASCQRSGGAGANPIVTPTAPPASLHTGHLFLGADATWFTPCGSTAKWLFQGDASPVIDYLKRRPHLAVPRGWAPPVVYVKLRGIVGEAPAAGSEKRWDQQIVVSEVIEVKRRADDCPAPTP